MLADASETNRTASILIGSLVVLSLVVFGVMLLRHGKQASRGDRGADRRRDRTGKQDLLRQIRHRPRNGAPRRVRQGLMEIRKRHQDRIVRDMMRRPLAPRSRLSHRQSGVNHRKGRNVRGRLGLAPDRRVS